MTGPANKPSRWHDVGASDDDAHADLAADGPPGGHCLSCGAWVPSHTLAGFECGYDIAEHNRLRLFLGFVGTMLTLIGVLAPVGMPMLWLAYRHRRRAEGSVTAAVETPFSDHILAVFRHHLGLSAYMEEGTRYTRGGSRGARELGQPPEL